MGSSRMTKGQLIVGFLWLTILISTANATTYNDSDLEEMYENATKLYRNSLYHWGMSSGYSDMLGDPGMKICFVEGPEVEALVLGGERSNVTSNVTLTLQREQTDVALPTSMFTVAFWYSFRPIDFFAVVNDTMACNLLEMGGGSNEKVEIMYDGPKEYNLKYRYYDGSNWYEIADNQDRPNWEFEVNDTYAGDIKLRGWQWSHIAMVFDGVVLKAYYNGFLINVSQSVATSSSSSSSLAKLILNVGLENGAPCGPVGYDEVTLWDNALPAYDILALRVHVGRNRSLDMPEPTTEALTSATLNTTPANTNAGDTTSVDTTVDGTTGGQDETTLELATSSVGDVTKQSTAGLSSSTVPGRTTNDPISTAGGQSVSPTPSPTTSDEPNTSTRSPTVMDVSSIAKIVNVSVLPEQIASNLKMLVSLVATATPSETIQITEDVTKVLEVSSTVKPGDVNSSVEDIAILKDFRKAYVGLFSSALERWEEESASVDGIRVAEALDTFLKNYIDDPTVASNESISSTSIDIQLAPVDGSTVRMEQNTSIDIPVDAFGTASGDVKVLACLLKRGLQNLIEPKDVQPINIDIVYSNQPSWNISGPILVMRASGRSGNVKLSKPVTFNVHVDPTLGEDPVCAYQDNADWSGEGVKLKSYNLDCSCITCETEHMTNFAVLMAVDGVPLTGTDAVLLSIISYVGCSLSLLCLTIAIILFIILRELNSTRMGIVKNLCVALFLAQLLFVVGIETATANEYACKAVAALLHYFFLCVLAWMLCNGIYLYQKVNLAIRPGSVVDLIYFCILGWGAPAIVVAITAGIDHKVYGTETLCWLSIEGDGIWAFVIPAMVIIIFNAFVTFLTMKAFVSVKVFKDKTDKDKFKSGLRAIVVLLPILGLSWIFGLLAFGETGIFFQYLFAIFNSLQGVFLFIFHIFLNEEVKGAMRRRFGKVGASGDENTLFNKIWAFSSTNAQEKTEMSSVSQTQTKSARPVYKN